MDPFERLMALLARPFACEALFDAIPDVVFFVKDADGRYVAVNRVLVERTGFDRKEALIGLRADEAFPGGLGARFAGQDRAVIESALPIRGELELHLYPGGIEGWCLTWKEPLFDQARKVAGLVGLSRDVRGSTSGSEETTALSQALHLAQHRPGSVTKVGELAERANLSPFQLDQRIRAMFGLSAAQYLTRLRIDHASERLRRTDKPIIQIALDCGYADQTAFSRQFRKVVGLAPGLYRRTRTDPDRGPPASVRDQRD